eukprot:6925078-Prymnesium_polylepis.1
MGLRRDGTDCVRLVWWGGEQMVRSYYRSTSLTRDRVGLWPMVRHKVVLERYAALRCLWHG